LFDPWNIFGNVFGTFGIPFIIIVVVNICRAGSSVASNVARGFTVEAPSFVIPERHRGRTRSDGTEMKTVRLPERCPSCGAAVSQEGIDWVGPLEAKCSYCGATLRATFESL
jgi:hypothetical protein